MVGRIDVEQKIDVYELNGKDTHITLGIDSHWNRATMVVIRLGEQEYTVIGADLTTAVENAMNTG